MGIDALRPLLDAQSGLISRRQLLAAGLRDHDIARLVRRRDLVRVHPRVYVNHTGDLTWRQRAWAAVLCYWPAALHGDSALRAHRGTGLDVVDDSPIHVAVDERRRPRPRPGVRLHRVSRLAERVHPNRHPARVTLEHAVVDVASAVVDDAGRRVAGSCSASCSTSRPVPTPRSSTVT